MLLFVQAACWGPAMHSIRRCDIRVMWPGGWRTRYFPNCMLLSSCVCEQNYASRKGCFNRRKLLQGLNCAGRIANLAVGVKDLALIPKIFVNVRKQRYDNDMLIILWRWRTRKVQEDHYRVYSFLRWKENRMGWEITGCWSLTAFIGKVLLKQKRTEL